MRLNSCNPGFSWATTFETKSPSNGPEWKGRGEISIDYNRGVFYWAPVSINNAQAQTFSQENKLDAIYGLATMTEYRLVSDLPLILRPD